MKKMVVLLVLAAMVYCVGVTKAADPNMPQRPHFDPNAIIGRVVVEKDASGAVKAVTIENKRRGDWKVVLDAKGKELGTTMDEKFVKVEGKVETKDGAKWVTVESFTEIKRPQGRPGGPNGHRGPGAPGQTPPAEGGK